MPSLGTGRQVRRVGMDSPQQSPRPVSLMAEVLYLLNRGAQLEHPHMIMVPYAAHQPGPTLRDVKARLIAVRGKGMPGSFSWSYKRTYKDSFIWCDLFEDDFILPLGESGEYVLKAMEIFDASPDEKMEYQDQLRFRSSSRVSSPGRGSSRPAARSEHIHVENDVSMAIKKSLLLINTPGDSMDVNKQVMHNLSYSKRAPEVCSIEHSDVSSSTPNSFEDVAESNKKCTNPELRNSPRNSGVARKLERKQCSSSSQIAHSEVIHGSSPSHENTDDRDQRVVKEMEVGQAPSWEKEIDKSTICTQFVYKKSSDDDDDEQVSPPGLELAHQSGSNAVAEDPFFFGVLRRASRLGSSFRPRLCRGVDVVDSTRTKSKLPFRSKSKHEDVEKPAAASFKSSPTSVHEEPAAQISLPPVKEFKTLSEYFEAQERQTPRSICKQLITSDEPNSLQEMLPSQHSMLSSAPKLLLESDQQPPEPVLREVVAPPSNRPASRPALSNEELDASYRKTMEVLAKLPTSRGACRIHTTTSSHAGVQGAQKVSKSESKGNKQEVKADTDKNAKWSAPSSRQAFNSQDGPILHDTCSIHGMDESPKKVASKQRRSAVKKGSGIASFEASTVSCRAKTVVKTSDEKKALRTGSKESTAKLLPSEQGDGALEDTTQLPDSFTFDSRAMRSGNKQGSRMAAQVATKVEVASAAIPKRSSHHEGAKPGWPFEQPVRPRDFKSREDRPLTPGLTSMDWEKSLQEAVMHSEPPVDLVLHECSQCGRTFKLESLKVHMRGCRAINKPKSSLSLERRVSV